MRWMQETGEVCRELEAFEVPREATLSQSKTVRSLTDGTMVSMACSGRGTGGRVEECTVESAAENRDPQARVRIPKWLA